MNSRQQYTMAYGLKASSCDPLILLLNTSHSHSKHVYYLNMLQSGGINVFRKMVNPETQFLQMVIFGVQTSWVGQRTPKTINHRWSMPHHDYFMHAVVFFFFFFFLIFHENYTRNFFSEPWDLGQFQIAKYHIFDALWHWKVGGGAK